MNDDALQLAWWDILFFFSCYPQTVLKTTRRSIINDTYRSDLRLFYPTRLLAITALYLTLVLHGPAMDPVLQKSSPNLPNDAHTSLLRRSSRQASTSSMESKEPQDIIGFFASLNMYVPPVSTIVQEMILLYLAWERYREDGDGSDTAHDAFQGPQPHAGRRIRRRRRRGGLKRTLSESRRGSHSCVGTPDEGAKEPGKMEGPSVVTPLTLVQLLTRMRENRLSDLAHSTHGRPVVVDKW